MLFLKPAGYRRNNMVLFAACQKPPLSYAVPFSKTGAAASCRGMLSDKDGMATHGSLPAVVGWRCGCEAFSNEIRPMAEYDW